MPKLKWYQYLAVGSFVAGWVGRSFMDNKITRAEIDELINGIRFIPTHVGNTPTASPGYRR